MRGEAGTVATARRGRGLRAAAVAALILSLGGCGSGADECDPCTSDEDCKAGLFCSTFSDGSRRCASGIGETSCRLR